MIVKNLLVVGVVAGFASAAAAQDSTKANWSIGGRVRVDANQSTEEMKGSETVKSSTSEVSLNRAQFTLTGTRDEHSLAITYYADNNELYSAVLSHNFSPMITAHFGRMKVLAQSIENSYEGIDIFDPSWALMHAPANSTGARIDFNLEGGHSLSVQAVEGLQGWSNDMEVNGETSTRKTEFNKSGGLTTAVQYRGSFNDMIKPVLTYTQVRTSSTKGTVSSGEESAAVNYGNGYQTQMGVGAQVAASGATVDIEYDTVKFHKQKDATGDKDSDIASLIAQVKYPVNKTTPFLKVASETWKYGAEKGVGDMTGMLLSLGVEHALDDSCRLHAIYSSNSSKTKAAAGQKDSEVTTTGFNFGVTASM